MKKSLLALAVLGAFAGAASAQTSVTIYGIADAGIVLESGGPAGSVSKLTGGVASGSRLGFRGVEDLGGGLSAFFVFEHGINLDTGNSPQGVTAAAPQGIAFGRSTYVGLRGNFGSFQLGRQYSPGFIILSAIADPFGTGTAGQASNIMSQSGLRTNNTIKYELPKLNGFNGSLAYGFGEVPGDTSAARSVAGSFGYANGPVNVAIGFHNQNIPGTDNSKTTILAGTYDFRVVKAHLAYDKNTGLTGTGSTDNTDFLLGATIPFGQHTVLTSFIHKNDKTALDRDANQWAVGYLYALSKRTDLYTVYARVNNKNGATYNIGNASAAGSGDKAFNLGLRHTF